MFDVTSTLSRILLARYIDPFKCLQLGIGMCLLSQPGLYRNDPLKYFLLIFAPGWGCG